MIEVDGQRQLIAPAAEATISYDPATGKELWRVLQPGGFNVAARPVYANGLVCVFTSGLTGYLMGIRPNGSGDVTKTHVAWSTTRSTPKIPSPIVVGDLMFMVTDKGGIARCLDATTGDEIWRMRLGGDHWVSPIHAGGNLYFSSKQGRTTVLPASREQPEIVARNQLNASFIASPAIAGDSLILRSTTHLYCLANGYELIQSRVSDPVSYALMPLRAMECWDKLPNTLTLSAWLLRMGQGLFRPPNVGGWDGGRRWLSTRTVVARTNYIHAIVNECFSDDKMLDDASRWLCQAASETGPCLSELAELLLGSEDTSGSGHARDRRSALVRALTSPSAHLH